MIELKGLCCGCSLCSSGRKSLSSGNAVWYQVSTIESLTLLGGSEALCCHAIWFKYNKNAVFKQVLHQIWLSQLTVRGQIYLDYRVVLASRTPTGPNYAVKHYFHSNPCRQKNNT
ncbi:hypothetical protein DPMN_089550 [Dreissena polymorpha]|uniref:Uncharacterized protein n=1 Tax=Dreissena polymorpha TaxID=45954 RepID=A0A9D4QYB8_DREPO|nr:hypothetical protein DPMN_089550 [Dreissena polymorpha]